MATRRLDEHDWGRYFDNVAGALRGREATVEVVAPDVGAQFAAVGLDVIGIAYDPKNELLEIALVAHPHLPGVRMHRRGAGAGAIPSPGPTCHTRRASAG